MEQAALLSLQELWIQNDALQKGVAYSLLAMSLISWTVILIKSWYFLRLSRYKIEANALLKNKFDLSECFNKLNKTPYGLILQAGAEAAQHHSTIQQVLLEQWVLAQLRAAIELVQEQFQQRLSYLATIGAIAPFVGLLGTVYGIYKALMTMSVTGKADITQISGPIAEALIMTGAGLAVAIPAVIFFNIFNRLTKKSVGHVKRFTQLVFPHFLIDKNSSVVKP